MSIEVGQLAPDFTLKDQYGQSVRLSDFRADLHVAVVFYPFAFSGLCTDELCELRDNIAVFQDDDVQVVAVSCDPMYSLRAFAEAQGYPFPLLADFWPHGEVAQAYGVFNDRIGRAERGTFLVDKDGVLRWSVVNHPGEPRSLVAYKGAVAAL